MIKAGQRMNFYLCPRCQFRIPSTKYMCSTCGLKITAVHENKEAVEESPVVITVKNSLFNKIFHFGRGREKSVDTNAEKPALSQ